MLPMPEKTDRKETMDAAIKSLWKTAFDDNDAFIDSFIDGMKKRYSRYTIIVNDVLVSMLHVVRFEMDGFLVGYIYGVATVPESRGLGHASRIIIKAIDECREQGFDALATIPADENLRLYYRKFGFEGCYRTIFHSPENFDFGTGDSEKDLSCILPLKNTFTLPAKQSIVVLQLLPDTEVRKTNKEAV